VRGILKAKVEDVESEPRGSSADYVALLVGGLLGLVVLGFSRIYVIDDAYISFRYAHQMVEGHGLVFNPGEYVEGYTSLLWTLLMAFPEGLDISVSSFAVSLGLGLGLLALFVVWRSCRLLGLSPWGTGAAMFGLGLYPEYWLTVTMGLEGGLIAFLLSSAFYQALSERWSWAGLFGGLLFATRPETILLIPVFAAYFVLTAVEDASSTRDYRHPIRRMFSLLAPWLAVVAIVTVWRLIYYGAWLPNSVVAKSPPEYSFETLWPNFHQGALYLAGFSLPSFLFALSAVLAVLLSWRMPAVWLCLGAVAAEAAAVLINGGDWMPNHRLLAAYAPLLAILLGIAVCRVSAMGWSGRLLGVVLLTGGALIMLWQHNWERSPDAHVRQADACYAAITTRLAPALRASDVIVPEAIGLASYVRPEIYVHDKLGLTDREVATNGPYYIPTLGKLHPMYTFYEVRPTVYFTHGDADEARWVEHLTGGEYSRRYSTYRLLQMTPAEAPDCQGEKTQYIVSVRKGGAEQRILPTLEPLKPRPLDIPYRKSYTPWFQRE
jgi:arabinofuranosyltransferase